MLLVKLDHARDVAGIPFYITSDYRPGDRRAHGRASAADFSTRPRSGLVTSHERFLTLRGLFVAGFHRIGIYDRHFHVDVDPELPQEVAWLGESR